MNWRPAASTILFTTTQRKVLMLRRGSTAKFMPNLYVFPGGVLDKTDGVFPQERSNFHSIVKSAKMEGFDNDYPHRIGALRELFEETGILLVRNEKKKEILTTTRDSGLNKLRDQVRARPEIFQDLFTDFKLDVARLIPWSNWLTPTSYKQRFDTLFFVIPVEEAIEVDICNKEMSDSVWISPEEILAKNTMSEEGVLAPPQYYELTRLGNTHPNRLSEMSNPCRICPQLIIPLEDPTKTIQILPGDHLYNYSDEVNLPPRRMSEEDIAKSELVDGVIHRITHFQPNFMRCQLHAKNVDRAQDKIRLFHV